MAEYRSIKDLNGKALVSAGSGQKIATVSDTMIDPNTLRVAALVISGGNVLKPERHMISGDDVEVWGKDVILIRENGDVLRDLNHPESESWLKSSDYLQGRAIVGLDGQKLGQLDDVLLDDRGYLVGYQLGQVSGEGPLAQSKFIPAGATRSLGKDVLLVDMSAAETAGASEAVARNRSAIHAAEERRLPDD